MSNALRASPRWLLVAVAAAVWLAWLSGPAQADERFADAEAAFVAQVNAERASAGLPALQVNAALQTVARDWSAVMAREARMYHNPDLAAQAPGDWQAVGENVGTSTHPALSSEEQVDRLHAAFMASPLHRANALGDWNQVAVGVVLAPPETMWVTVNFLRGPIPEPAPPPPPAPTQPAHVREALAISQEVFADDGSAEQVVLSRAEAFADALGGAALAGSEGPVLFTPGPTDEHPDRPLAPDVKTEIDRVLVDGGTVYVLGGPAAISGAAERELHQAGRRVVRLAGPSRTDTAVRVAEEVYRVRGDRGEVLIAAAGNWPDAVTGGAYAAHAGVPVLLTDRDAAPDELRAFLNRTNPARRWILGGQAAVSDHAAAQLGGTRLFGPDRTATAVAIAQQLWVRDEAGAGHGLIVIPGFRDDGWAYALAYAPLSAGSARPQLLVGNDLSPAVRQYLLEAGYDRVSPTPLRFASTVPTAAAEALRALIEP